MIFFGHIGITTAIMKKYEKDKKIRIDYRYVIIGSILPDLIDKPIELLANYKFPQSGGRMYGHTLLFTVIILAIGMIYNFKYKNVFILGLCSLIHIVLLDGMWLDPKVFLFPAFGFNLLGKKNYDIIPIISAIYISPAYMIIGEIVGIFILYKYVKGRMHKNNVSYKEVYKRDFLIKTIKRLITKPIYSSATEQEVRK